MSEQKRYTVMTAVPTDGGWPVAGPVEMVRLEDHVAEVAALTDERDQLKADLSQWHGLAADGTPIVERVREDALAKIQLVTGWYEGAGREKEIIEEACMQWAAAEERVRVLTEALKLVQVAFCDTECERHPNKHQEECLVALAALAAPAPEQPTQRYRLNSGQCAAQSINQKAGSK